MSGLDILSYLPDILESDERNIFKKSVESLSKGEDIEYSNYYETGISRLPEDEVSQGDVIDALQYITLPVTEFPIESLDTRPAMILSNSCYTSPNNTRLASARLLYAPIIELAKFETMFADEPGIANLVSDIKKQVPANYFFLPEYPGRYPESIVVFDNMLSSDFDLSADVIKSSTRYKLTITSYYHLLIKLSIFFSRTNPDLVRERAVTV